MKMFNLIKVGERAGSGVPEIFNVWEEEGWAPPVVEEVFKPDRTILTLSFTDKAAEKQPNPSAIPPKSRRKSAEIGGKICEKSSVKSSKKRIRAFLRRNGGAKTKEIAAYLGLRASRTKVLIAEMVDEGVVVAEGNARARRYSLADNPSSNKS